MNSIKKLYYSSLVVIGTIVFYSSHTFAGGKGDETTIETKIDTSNLKGISHWLVTLYNDERIWYSILVTLCMALVGVLIAKIADVFLKIAGFEVSKIEHNE